MYDFISSLLLLFLNAMVSSATFKSGALYRKSMIIFIMIAK